MSFLAPLFLFGSLAIALPIVYHLIRRSTRERMPFSSLMFLEPSPPRVTRRSRLENLWLLFLRCLVLCLLALGFARPFVQKPVDSAQPPGSTRKTAVLLDTSASMKRGNLWSAALDQTREVLNELDPADAAALLTFDQRVTTRMSFDEWRSLPAGDRATHLVQQVQAIQPTWRGSDLGNALIAASELLEEEATGAERESVGPREIIVVTDLQQGMQLEALQGYDWPNQTQVIVKSIEGPDTSNAGLQVVASPRSASAASTEPVIRVRVTNAARSREEQFHLQWRNGDTGQTSEPFEVYVPPGESRVLRAPDIPEGLDPSQLELVGDEEPFDNTAYLVPPSQEQIPVVYWGREQTSEPSRLLYYLQRAFQSTPHSSVRLISAQPGSALPAQAMDEATLMLLAEPWPEDQDGTLKSFLRNGNTMVAVMKNRQIAEAVARLLDLDSFKVQEPESNEYVMLAEIDFQHPLFAPFSDPQYSDFTKIHFWHHWKIPAQNPPGARVLARFDCDDPALLEFTVDQGKMLIFTSSWQPADSQFALSTKFVPWLYSLLAWSGGLNNRPSQYLVGQPILFPDDPPSEFTLKQPDRTEIEWTPDSALPAPEQPGIYSLNTPDDSYRLAFNLAPEESQTGPLPMHDLEALRVPLQPLDPKAAALKQKQKQYLKAVELEGRQKIWRWLLAAAVIVLLLESWLAGRLTRGRLSPQPAEPQAG